MAPVTFRPSVPSANPAAGMSQPVQVIDQCGHVFESSFIEKLYYQAVQAGRELRCPVSQMPINRQKLQVVRNAAEVDPMTRLLAMMTDMSGRLRTMEIDQRITRRQIHNLQNIGLRGQLAITLLCYSQDSYLNEGVDVEEITRQVDEEATARLATSSAPSPAEPVQQQAAISPDRYAVPERDEEPGAVREDERYARRF
jgi:hypothetical protein